MRPEKGKRQEKGAEPDYAWGECPAGVPEVRWERPGRGLWAQVVPDRRAVLLMEKDRLLFLDAACGDLLWEQAAGDLPDELEQDGDGLFLAVDQDLRSLDPASGRQQWQRRLGKPITGLALDAACVYAATEGPLFALDRRDGSTRWRGPRSPEALLHAYPGAGLLVVADPEAGLLAFDTGSGEKRWEFAQQGEPLVPGPLAEGLLLVSAAGAGVAAIDTGTGEPRWRLETDGIVDTPGVVAAGRAWITDGTLYAVDPRAGEITGRYAIDDEAERIYGLRTDGDTLFAETWQGGLLAFSPHDGSLRWQQRPGQVHGLTGDERRIYLRVSLVEPENAWSVVALERATGKLAWELRARRMVADATRVGGTLVVEMKSRVIGVAA